MRYVIAWWIALALVSTIGRAQAPTALPRDEAEQLIGQAEALLIQRLPAQAVPLLERSLELHQSTKAAWYLATAHFRLGDILKSERILLDLQRGLYGPLREDVSPEDPNASPLDVANFLISCGNRIARLELLISPSPMPQGLIATVDANIVAVETDRSRIAMRVNPGEHLVLLTAPDYQTTSHAFTVGEGELAQIELTLEPETVPESERRAHLIVRTDNPSTQVRILDWAEGMGEVEATLAPGAYDIEVSNEHGTSRRSVTLAPGDERTLFVDAPVRRRRAWPWIVGSVGVLSLATILSVVLLLPSKMLHGDIETDL